MSGLLRLIANAAMVTAAHTQGHFQEANNRRLDIGLNAGNLSEQYRPRNGREQARMGGAGFTAQDSYTATLNGTEYEQSAHIVSAIEKIGYLLGAPNYLSQRMGGEGLVQDGDLGEIDRGVGKNYGREILAITAAADLLQPVMPQGMTVSYGQSMRGTPMLNISGEF